METSELEDYKLLAWLGQPDECTHMFREFHCRCGTAGAIATSTYVPDKTWCGAFKTPANYCADSHNRGAGLRLRGNFSLSARPKAPRKSKTTTTKFTTTSTTTTTTTTLLLLLLLLYYYYYYFTTTTTTTTTTTS